MGRFKNDGFINANNGCNSGHYAGGCKYLFLFLKNDIYLFSYLT